MAKAPFFGLEPLLKKIFHFADRFSPRIPHY
jgi:hypothetical protein